MKKFLFLFLSFPILCNSQSFISFGFGFSKFSKYNNELNNIGLSSVDNIIPLTLVYNKRLNNNICLSGGVEYQIYRPFERKFIALRSPNFLKIPLTFMFKKMNSKFYFLSGIFLKNRSIISSNLFDADNFLGLSIGTVFNLTMPSKYVMAIQLDVDHNITNTAKNIDSSAWNIIYPNDPITAGGSNYLTRSFNELVINIRFIINLNIINKTY